MTEVVKAQMSGGSAVRHVETCFRRFELSMSSILFDYGAIKVGNLQT